MRIYSLWNLQSHTLLCHEMVKIWQNEYGWGGFGGVLAEKGMPVGDYMKTQTDVQYDYVDVFDELEEQALHYSVDYQRLKLWEERLDCPLWQLVIADRQLGRAFVKGALLPDTKLVKISNHEMMQRFVLYFLDFFEERLQLMKPDAVFCIAVASLPSLALTKVCEYLQIPHYTVRPLRIDNKFVILKNSVFDQFTHAEKYYEAWRTGKLDVPPISAEARSVLSKFQMEQPPRPDYEITSQKRLKQQSEFNWLKVGGYISYWGVGAFYLWLRGVWQGESYLRQEQPLSKFYAKTKNLLALKQSGRYWDDLPPLGEEPYVLFPLHMNPEASTMIYAPNFVDQEIVIANLVKNLPLTHKLYVKEHPIMVGRRPRGFYDSLRQWPNVRVVIANADSFELIRYSDLVTVITGTMGWEAILMGKPVLTFGRCFYSGIGLSTYCTDWEQMGDEIYKLITGVNAVTGVERQERLELFIMALLQNSFPLSTAAMWPPKPYELGDLPPEAVKFSHDLAHQLAKAMQTDGDDESFLL
ncbi:MAG TPA: hypothetical protein VLL52_15670 [Anaerolineae bacterium]|nr:hypothetical protein [Anaerolineae bacterium]